MAKTYTAAGSATAGDVYTASAHNVIVTDVNNLVVPSTVSVRLTSDKTYTSASNISWDAEDFDTDSMWASGTSISINTTGLYLVTFHGRVTGTSGFTYVLPSIKQSGGEARIGTVSVISSTDYRFNATALMSLSAASTLTFDVVFAGGGTVTLNGSDTQGSRTRASVCWIGQTTF